MKKTKRNGGKALDGRNCSGNENKPKDIECWHSLYKTELDGLNEEQRSLLETYRESMLTGITKITKGCSLEKLENWENIKEKFAYEVLTPRIPLYLRGDFSIPQAVQLAKKLTLKRQGSWFRSLFRQQKNIQLFPERFIIERDEDGEVCEVGTALPDWTPPLAPLDPYRTDPEACLLRLEEIKHVKKLPEMVGNCGKKWASLYQGLLEIQLSGENVGPKHRERLGVETDKKLREFKWQAKREAEKKTAEIFPDLKENQKVCKDQRGKQRKV